MGTLKYSDLLMSTFCKVLSTYSSIFKTSVLSTYSSTFKNASTQDLLEYCTSVLTPSLQKIHRTQQGRKNNWQLSHSVYPSVCRTDGYGTDRRLQEHTLFRAKNVLYSFSSKTVRFEYIVISALHVHLLSSKTP